MEAQKELAGDGVGSIRHQSSAWRPTHAPPPHRRTLPDHRHVGRALRTCPLAHTARPRHGTGTLWRHQSPAVERCASLAKRLDPLLYRPLAPRLRRGHTLPTHGPFPTSADRTSADELLKVERQLQSKRRGLPSSRLRRPSRAPRVPSDRLRDSGVRIPVAAELSLRALI